MYRVPDAIDLGKLLGARVVEWDVVHACEGTLPPAATLASAFFEARRRWVDRAPGEPSPLDEDLGLDVLARAGVGPELTLGIARELAISHRGGDSDESSSTILATVRGVHVLADASASAAIAAASGEEPWPVVHEPPVGVVVDVLHWDAIAQAIHPVRQRRALLPSPFSYLPLTPQELLRAYIEIVGVKPADAYSAQVTHDRPFDLMGRTSTKWGVRRTGGGPDLPCADGKLRKRMAGGHHVVVAYRDRPEYAEGRARFDAYAEDELQARLRQMLGVRAPVPKPPGKLSKTIDRVGDVVEFFTMDPTGDHDPVPPRYCWPPRGA